MALKDNGGGLLGFGHVQLRKKVSNRPVRPKVEYKVTSQPSQRPHWQGWRPLA